jgi:peptidoglycan/LPS O-acetylase OafA/YrhL
LQESVHGILGKVLSRLTPVPSFAPSSGVAWIALLFLFALATDYLFDFPVRQWLSRTRTLSGIGRRREIPRRLPQPMTAELTHDA